MIFRRRDRSELNRFLNQFIAIGVPHGIIAKEFF